jgi:hypothetical protein
MADALNVTPPSAIVAAASPIAILRSIMLKLLCCEHPSLCESNSSIVIGLQCVFNPSGTLGDASLANENMGCCESSHVSRLLFFERNPPSLEAWPTSSSSNPITGRPRADPGQNHEPAQGARTAGRQTKGPYKSADSTASTDFVVNCPKARVPVGRRQSHGLKATRPAKLDGIAAAEAPSATQTSHARRGQARGSPRRPRVRGKPAPCFGRSAVNPATNFSVAPVRRQNRAVG